MAKKKHAEEHENLERWLVSYADFMTLLFATFVVLYALSQSDRQKMQESIRKAFSSPSIIESNTGHDKSMILDSAGSSIMSEGASADNAPITPILEAMEEKVETTDFNIIKDEINKISKDLNKDGINAIVNDRGLVITLSDSILFNSGSATLTPKSIKALKKLAKILKDKINDHTIRVEGHTDNLQASSDKFPSNWELSSSRASNVVRFFISNFKFESNRFAAVGYADSVPIASNSNEEGRKKNRRVEIIVLKNKLLGAEPNVPGLNQLRSKKMQEYAQKTFDENFKANNNPYENKHQDTSKTKPENSSGLSDAAINLIKESKDKNSSKEVITYKDTYDAESEKLAKELKSQESNFKY